MKLIGFGLILSLFLSVAFSVGAAAPPRIIRVAVLKDVQQIKLAVRSPYQILALNTSELLAEGRRIWRAKVIPTETGIRIGKDNFKIYGVRIQPRKSPSIYLNGRRFRGAVDIIRQSNQRLLVINYLDVEEYVAGVLYHEVAPWWPLEALKAQAIASRTYALYQSVVNAPKDYDLVSTVYSQMYGGRTSERGRTSKAIKLTKGKVLTYKMKLFPAFYHATCAGHTEDAAQLWKINLPPLRGRPCQFCRRSPHFRWKKKVSLRKIEAALQKADVQVGAISAIKIVERNISGRVTDLEIISTQGRTKISANRFRLAIGPNSIKSTNFELRLKKGSVYFDGYGWGHGVGMCQWGAFFMSRKRFNAQQILGYYYPESKIKHIEQVIDANGEIAIN